MKKTMKFGTVGLLLGATVLASACGNQAATSTGGSSTAEAPKEAVKFPTKPIELIVPYAAGGGTDLVGRAIAEALKPILGQDVVVVNKTGGSGAVGTNEVAQAKGDGYKMVVATREIVSNPLLGLAPFKTTDFKFVGNLNRDPALIVVSSKSKYKTFEDLLGDIKANPGKLNFASSSTPSLYGIPFAEAAKLDYVTIPFQGTAQAVVEVLGGRAEFGIYNPGEVKSQIESGDLLPLAVMNDKRLEGFFKDVPTVKEKGINVDWAGTYRGIAVPKDTPDEIVKILEEAVGKAVKDQKFVDFMNKQNLFIDYLNASQFQEMIKKDTVALDAIVQVVNKQKK